MALILNIDTATDYASLALSDNDQVLAGSTNKEIRDHAAWIHDAIQKLMAASGVSLSELDAIAVTAGPGSYTGLRVGMATAKGLCYVLNVPLITENTLKVMAYAAVSQIANRNPGTLLVPMIDARRMEVFTAVYDGNLSVVMSPTAMVLDATCFEDIAGNPLICFGNGSGKFQSIADPARFQFMDVRTDATSLSQLAFQKFQDRDFTDLAYSEPLYLKEFYSPEKK